MVIIGSLAGYLISAWLTDAIGRRRGFILFAGGAALLIVLYTHLPVAGGMFLIGFPLGFFIAGDILRHGRLLGRVVPGCRARFGAGIYLQRRARHRRLLSVVDRLIEHRFPLGDAIAGFTVIAYALVIASALAMPETRGPCSLESA